MSAALIAAAADTFKALVDEIMGPSRAPHLVMARCAIAYVLRKRDERSFPTIARRLQRDPQTVQHAVRRAAYWSERNPEFARFVAAQMALPKHSPEAARLKIPKEVQLQFRLAPTRPTAAADELRDRTIRRSRFTRVQVNAGAKRLTMAIDEDGLGIDDHLDRNARKAASEGLLKAIRREHPERWAA